MSMHYVIDALTIGDTGNILPWYRKQLIGIVIND